MKKSIVVLALLFVVTSARQLLGQTNVGTIDIMLKPGERAVISVTIQSPWEGNINVFGEDNKVVSGSTFNNQRPDVGLKASGEFTIPTNASGEAKRFVITCNHKRGAAFQPGTPADFVPSLVKPIFSEKNIFHYGVEFSDPVSYSFLDAKVKVTIIKGEEKPKE